jgi:hypothetical protein
METFTRKLSEQEIEDLKYRITETKVMIRQSFGKWLLISAVTLLPMFIFYSLLGETGRIVYLIANQLLVITFGIIIYKPFEKLQTNKLIRREIREGLAEVTNIKTTKAKVCTYNNIIAQGYYLDIGNGKTIYLQNEDFERLENIERFPNTDFDIVETARHKIYITTITKGELLNPKFITFYKENHVPGPVHHNRQIIDKQIEEININAVL